MKATIFHFLVLGYLLFPSFSDDHFFKGLDQDSTQSTNTQGNQKSTPDFFSGAEIALPVIRPYAEYFAYVHSQLVTLQGTDVVINRAYLNLRSEASRHSKILDMAKRGDLFPYAGSVTSPDDGAQWFKIWIRDPLITEPGGERVPAKVIAPKSLYLRKTPPRNGRNGQIIGILLKDEKILVDLDKSVGNWYRVYATGQSGYALKRYIELIRHKGDEGSFLAPDTSVRPKPRPENPVPVPTPKPDELTTPPTQEKEDPLPSTGERGAIRRADGGVEIRDIPLFFQGRKDPFDPNGGKGWRPHAYCGPTSLQMVLAYHGVQKSRDSLALTRLGSTGQVLATNYRSSTFRGQMYAKNQGSAYAPMVNMAKHLGFEKTKRQYPTLEPTRNSKKTSMRELLEQGRPQIVSVRGLLRYTDGSQWRSQGHIMVIRGMTGKGDLIVHDPARNGGNKIMRKRDFMKIWRGFTVDVQR